MISVSDEWRENFYENRTHLQIRAVLTLASGIVYYLDYEEDDDDFISMAFADAVSNETSFDVGNFVLNTCDFKLNNSDRRWKNIILENAELVPYVGMTLPSGDTEWLKKGTFYVTDTGKRGSRISLTAYDNTNAFETSFSGVSISYPITLGNFVQTICDYVGVTLATTTFPNSTYSLSTAPSTSSTDYTCRQMISYAAMLAGCFARCNVDGELEIKWYEAVDEDSQNYHNIEAYASLETGEADTEITGVKVVAMASENVDSTTDDDDSSESESESDEYTYGSTDGYLITVQENPLIPYGKAEEVAKLIGAQIVGTTFRDVEMQTLYDPSMEAGDTAITTDKDGETITFFVANISVTLGSYVSIRCSSTDDNSSSGSTSVLSYIMGQTADLVNAKFYNFITKNLSAEIANIGYLTAEEIDATYIATDKLQAKIAEFGYVTADEIDATVANFITVNTSQIYAALADFGYLTVDNLDATVADILKLSTSELYAAVASLGYVTADTISTTYLRADFANLTLANAETFFATVGILKDMTVGDASITGTLSGVTINGDCIIANTIVADSLVLKGADGLYYAINATSETLTSEELTDEKYQQYIDGSVLVAESITATQIAAGTITALQIASETITGDNIAALSITADKLSVNDLSAITANLGAITAGSITIYDDDGETIIFQADMDSKTLIVNTDGFTLDSDGNSTFSGTLNAATGTFSGKLEASEIYISAEEEVIGIYTTAPTLGGSSSSSGSSGVFNGTYSTLLRMSAGYGLYVKTVYEPSEEGDDYDCITMSQSRIDGFYVTATTYAYGSPIEDYANLKIVYDSITLRVLVSSVEVTSMVLSDTGIALDGAVTMSSTLSVSGATKLSSTLAVSGATTLSSTLSVASTTTTRAILPYATTTYNIGSSSYRYNYVYARYLNISSTSTLSGAVTVSSSLTLDAGSTSEAIKFSTPNITLRTSGNSSSGWNVSFYDNNNSAFLMQFTTESKIIASQPLSCSSTLTCNGNVYIANNCNLYAYDTDGTARRIAILDSSNDYYYATGGVSNNIYIGTSSSTTYMYLRAGTRIYYYSDHHVWYPTTSFTTSNTGLMFMFQSYASSSVVTSTSSTHCLFCGGADSTSTFIRSYCTYNRTSSSSANVYITSSGTFARYSSSASRYKNTINYFTNVDYASSEGLAKRDYTVDESDYRDDYRVILKFPVVQFHYNEGYMVGEADYDYTKYVTGFIAEDIASLCPSCATYNEDGTIEAWNYMEMIPRMVACIQDVYTDVSLIDDRVTVLEAQLAEAQLEIATLKKQLQAVA